MQPLSPPVLHADANQATLVKYACPGCREAIYTTPPLNILVLCTLCEEVLVAVDMPEF